MMLQLNVRNVAIGFANPARISVVRRHCVPIAVVLKWLAPHLKVGAK
jgi:hypothetical protein